MPLSWVQYLALWKYISGRLLAHKGKASQAKVRIETLEIRKRPGVNEVAFGNSQCKND